MPIIRKPIARQDVLHSALSRHLTVKLNRHVTAQDARAILEAIPYVIIETMKTGQDVNLLKFGRFSISRVPSKANGIVPGGRLPQYHTLNFTASRFLRDYVTQVFKDEE